MFKYLKLDDLNTEIDKRISNASQMILTTWVHISQWLDRVNMFSLRVAIFTNFHVCAGFALEVTPNTRKLFLTMDADELGLRYFLN